MLMATMTPMVLITVVLSVAVMGRMIALSSLACFYAVGFKVDGITIQLYEVFSAGVYLKVECFGTVANLGDGNVGYVTRLTRPTQSTMVLMMVSLVLFVDHTSACFLCLCLRRWSRSCWSVVAIFITVAGNVDGKNGRTFAPMMGSMISVTRRLLMLLI